jgi:hypothetical protein
MAKKLNDIADIVVEILDDNTCHDVESFKTKVSLHLRNLASSLSNNFDQGRWDKYISKKRKEAKKPIEMDPMQQAMLSLAKAKFKKGK